MKKMAENDTLIKKHTSVHATCHQCQAHSLPIMCRNFDCQIYFQRLKIDRKLFAAPVDLDRLLDW
jgi:hypothetical protein